MICRLDPSSLRELDSEYATELSYGATLCPSCNTNEIIIAKQCKACYQKNYYQTHKEAIKQTAKKQYKRLKANVAKSTVVHIHIHFHKEG